MKLRGNLGGKKMNAIILAAGMGTRLRPLTDNTPKALVKVNGQAMIERQITYLKEIGIDDIIVVTGYLNREFNYLSHKYGVKLIFNDKYDVYNNGYTMYLVREYLKDSYVIEGDVYLTNNFLKDDLDSSVYFSGMKEEFDSEWILTFNDKDEVSDISIGSGSDYIMSGVSYWVAEDSRKIKEKLEEAVESVGFENLFWDDIVKDNLEEFNIRISKIGPTDWFEIDSLDDLQKAEEFLKNES